MAAPMFDFCQVRQLFKSAVSKSLHENQISFIEEAFDDAAGSEGEKKVTLDQAFREVLQEVVKDDPVIELCTALVSLAVDAITQDLCTASLPFLMLADLLDCVTLVECEQVFEFVEERVSLWNSETYYSAGKNYLLRMCNDLLRRLSQSQNTVFCGRIQLFLARLFPLSEMSGLNLMSQFNVENTTSYTKAEDYERQTRQSMDEREESKEMEEGETGDDKSSITIDYNLYKKFWSLQDFFRKPSQCYDKTQWKIFCDYTEEVLGCFRSFKLDDIRHQAAQIDPDSHTYFAKYLTSEKLLDLQLSDSNFRRYVLVQFLILFQYLNAHVKFKNASQILSEEQANWMKQTTDCVLGILKETPPDGEQFAKAIEHILSREENWNSWKNESCPSYVKLPDSEHKSTLKSARSKKRSIGDDLKASGGKLIKMGNGELTRLWNLCPDNMEAAKSADRNFRPTLESFFEDAIEQADPEAQIEEEYKLVKNPSFAWKAMRLLAIRSRHFFSQQSITQIHKKQHEYLEDMVAHLAKEMNTASPDIERTDVEGDETQEEQNGDTLDREDEQSQSNTQREEEEEQQRDEMLQPMTKDLTKLLAASLGAEWKKLATELNFQDDDVAYFESETEDIEAQALKMLTVWQENEPERATVGGMRTALKEIGQESMAIHVFGEFLDV